MASAPEEPSRPATIVHEAQRTFDGSGVVLWGAELTPDEAADRRRRGEDIVVRGNDLAANRAQARAVEAMVGMPSRPQFPHPSAGRHALPHFHQLSRSPTGHSFYETPRLKARKRT
jgi:hypothetical protein